MRLKAYFDLRAAEGNPESLAAFGRRTGIEPSTIRKIRDGGGTTVERALRISAATGGLVRLEDLGPDPIRQKIAASR